jgi:hypothetical protein
LRQKRVVAERGAQEEEISFFKMLEAREKDSMAGTGRVLKVTSRDVIGQEHFRDRNYSFAVATASVLPAMSPRSVHGCSAGGPPNVLEPSLIGYSAVLYNQATLPYFSVLLTPPSMIRGIKEAVLDYRSIMRTPCTLHIFNCFPLLIVKS